MKPTAQSDVLLSLRHDIVTGSLAPGAQVVQETLAEHYGVSRVPVREALKILEGEGLVNYYPHRGYFVATLSTDDLLEVYRLREILETEAIEHAVTALTDEDCDALAELLVAVDSALRGEDLAAITAANRRFHFALFDSSGMPRLVRLLRQLWDATDVYRSVYFAASPNRDRVHDEHVEILQALRKRDTAAVVRWHNIHRQNTITAVTAMIQARALKGAAN